MWLLCVLVTFPHARGILKAPPSMFLKGMCTAAAVYLYCVLLYTENQTTRNLYRKRRPLFENTLTTEIYLTIQSGTFFYICLMEMRKWRMAPKHYKAHGTFVRPSTRIRSHSWQCPWENYQLVSKMTIFSLHICVEDDSISTKLFRCFFGCSLHICALSSSLCSVNFLFLGNNSSSTICLFFYFRCTGRRFWNKRWFTTRRCLVNR